MRAPGPDGGRPRRGSALLRSLLPLAALLTLMGCGGCSPLYVLRSAYEETRILLARQSIEDLIENPELDPETRRKLELVLQVRRFAEAELGLHVGEAYASFSIVPPGALLHVVSAAEQTQLVPYTWWFPIVGSVDYKGYFELAEAEEEAQRLRSERYDTWVRPSAAFSTLGWFDDPVLSTWMRAGDVRIAELLIHELLHRTYYVSGHTDFNESLATFVGHRGAIAFFVARDGAEADTTQRAIADWQAALAESRLWGGAVARLEALYARGAAGDLPREQILADRQRIFTALEIGEDADVEAATPPGPVTVVPPPAGAAASSRPLARRRTPSPLNNAVILANYTYLKDLHLFEQVYDEAGGLSAAIAHIRELTEDAEDPFAALAAARGTSGTAG